jgi:peptide/nickel transport system permease protein
VTAFVVRRLLLALAVLLATSIGVFVLMATHFSSTCSSEYTPIGDLAPPLASNAGQALRLYWRWLQEIPSGEAFGQVCGVQTSAQTIGPAFGHTAALLGLTAIVVLVVSLLLGIASATRAGTPVDGALRGFSYAAWAVPPFVLALLLMSGLDRLGWFPGLGWPGSCLEQGGFIHTCGPDESTAAHVGSILKHLIAPVLALSVAFIGIHSRYLRSSLLVTFGAPFITTARSKGLSERRVVLRHALRISLAPFVATFLLDFGAIFGAAMAVDWVYKLNGLGSLLISEIAGVGSGDGPRYLDPYAIETLLTGAAVLVVVSSVAAELVIAWLDPRARA